MDLSSTPRTRLGRLRERAQTDRSALYEVLDGGIVCHLGVVHDGSPMVIPTGYGRIDDTLYLHGSTGARSLREAIGGVPVCVTVTHVDGVVLARSAFHHSMNYRSAMIFGTATIVDEPAEKSRALRALSEQLAPGQWDVVRQPDPKEMAATAVLSLPLAEASVKVRQGPPSDDDEDYALPVWAGVLPLEVSWGTPLPDPALKPGLAVPDHITSRGREPDKVLSTSD